MNAWQDFVHFLETRFTSPLTRRSKSSCSQTSSTNSTSLGSPLLTSPLLARPSSASTEPSSAAHDRWLRETSSRVSPFLARLRSAAMEIVMPPRSLSAAAGRSERRRGRQPSVRAESRPTSTTFVAQRAMVLAQGHTPSLLTLRRSPSLSASVVPTEEDESPGSDDAATVITSPRPVHSIEMRSPTPMASNSPHPPGRLRTSRGGDSHDEQYIRPKAIAPHME